MHKLINTDYSLPKIMFNYLQIYHYLFSSYGIVHNLVCSSPANRNAVANCAIVCGANNTFVPEGIVTPSTTKLR